jgi:hypothetical protein
MAYTSHLPVTNSEEFAQEWAGGIRINPLGISGKCWNGWAKCEKVILQIKS